MKELLESSNPNFLYRFRSYRDIYSAVKSFDLKHIFACSAANTPLHTDPFHHCFSRQITIKIYFYSGWNFNYRSDQYCTDRTAGNY